MYLWIIRGFLCALILNTALAQELKPEWELGVVGLATSQQAYPGSSYQQPAGLVAPLLVYRGKFLRSGQGGVGLRAINQSNFELDIGFAGSFGSNSSKIPVRQGMSNLGSLIEFGPRGKWYISGKDTAQTAWFELPIRGVFDIGNHAKQVGITAEPQLAYETTINAWRLSGSLGLLIGDRRMNQHFYGVDAGLVNSNRPAFQARAGLTAVKTGLTASYAVTPQFSVFGFARINTVKGAKNSSNPLIDQKHGASYGVGAVYIFLQSDAMVKP